MNFYLKFFLLELKQQLLKPKNWLMLLLLFALLSIISLCLPKIESTAPVQVAFVFNDEKGEELFNLLNNKSNAAVSFIKKDLEAADALVSAGLCDCCVVLPLDFGQHLQKADTENLIEIHISENSLVYPLIKESLSAALAELASADWAENFLIKEGLLEEQSKKEIYKALIEEERVNVKIENLSGKAFNLKSSFGKAIKSLLKLPFLMILPAAFLFGLSDSLTKLKEPFLKRLSSIKSKTALFICLFLAESLPIFIIASLCSTILKL